MKGIERFIFNVIAVAIILIVIVLNMVRINF